MKQELKPVTTNGHVLLVDEKAEIKIGDYYWNPSDTQFGAPHYERCEYKHEEKACLSEPRCLKIVCQPINSSIDGIPYYQTEEETAEDIANKYMNELGDLGGDILSEKYYSFIAGYKAAKAKEFTEDDIRKAHFHGWFQRERYDGVVGKNGYEGKYPDNWKDMDYEEREEWFCNQLITSLRKPRRIVSASFVMEEGCELKRCACKENEWSYDKTCKRYQEKPIFYTKEIDGKMLEFLSVEIIYG